MLIRRRFRIWISKEFLPVNEVRRAYYHKWEERISTLIGTTSRLTKLTWMSSIAWCIPTNTSHSWDSKGRPLTTSIWASVAFLISLVLIRCHRPRFHSVCCSWTARHVFHTSRKHSRSERRLLKINDQRHKVSASRYGWGNVFSFVHNKEEPSLHKCGNVITGSCTPQVGWKFPRGKSQSARICGWQKPLIYPYPHRRNSLSFSL